MNLLAYTCIACLSVFPLLKVQSAAAAPLDTSQTGQFVMQTPAKSYTPVMTAMT